MNVLLAPAASAVLVQVKTQWLERVWRGLPVWVSGETNHDITILDAQSGKRLGQVSVGLRPRSVAFLPDGSKAYSANEAGGTVSVIDVATRKVTGTITLPEGSKPMTILAAADGQRLYVSNGRGGTVSAIDVATNQVTQSVAVGKRPWGIALSKDGGKLYSANGPSNDVSVIDLATFTVVKTIPAGKVPWGVAVGSAP